MKPKTFSLRWGKGIVAEEAQIISEYHLPTIQLLEFTEGVAEGQTQIRFCYYSPRGGFQRAPLIIDKSEIRPLRKAIKQCPKLHRLLKQLV